MSDLPPQDTPPIPDQSDSDLSDLLLALNGLSDEPTPPKPSSESDASLQLERANLRAIFAVPASEASADDAPALPPPPEAPTLPPSLAIATAPIPEELPEESETPAQAPIIASAEAPKIEAETPAVETPQSESAISTDEAQAESAISTDEAQAESVASTDEVQAESVASTDEVQAETPPVYLYRVAVVLLPALRDQIRQARATIGMEDAPIGIFSLQTDFKTEAIESVQAALKGWAQAHLPLTVTVERVEAVVEGSQRYLAGFALEPTEAVLNLRQTLLESLQTQIEPIPPADELPFAPRLLVADHVPAAGFPKLVHWLQNHFESLDWRIEAVELLQVPETESDQRWEVLEKIG